MGEKVVSLDDRRKEEKLKKELKEKYKKELIKDSKFLYQWCLDEGYSEGGAFKLTEEITEEINKYYRSVEHGTSVNEVQKSIEVDFLEKHTAYKYMTEENISDLLWSLGINTKTEPYGEMRRLVRKGCNLELRKVVYGMERRDKEWLSMRAPDFTRYASDEARGISITL